MSKAILTLTVNPAIDGASDADHIRPAHKIRTTNERFAPGGGGINVARVLTRLGTPARACYLAGGATGALLDTLMDRAGVARRSVPILGDTRINHSVYDRSTDQEYRFVSVGPEIREPEWRGLIDTLAEQPFDLLIASGSLAPDMPDDFYARLLPVVQAAGARMILDTSGAALKITARTGGLWLIKPSHGEFEDLVGQTCSDPEVIGAAAQALARQGMADIIVVSLDHDGAVYADRNRHFHRIPPTVQAHGSVGAGDSFVGAMALRLMQGWAPERAFLYGMAAGTAAVLTPGTDLCRPEDVETLFARLEKGD